MSHQQESSQGIAQEESAEFSVTYLIFIFVIGFGIVGVIAVAGGRGWPLIPTILVGAGAQTAFRVAKRVWSNELAEKNSSDDDDDRLLTLDALKTFGGIFLVMIVVSLFWYGAGFGIANLWKLVF